MEELIQKMKVYLASNFDLYLKAHNFHWNVMGPDFPQLHDFFGEVYQELWDAVDAIAEQIRQLDAYAPGSLGRFNELSILKGERNVSDAKSMIDKLNSDNKLIIPLLKSIYRMCEENEQVGLSNFIQDRIMAHTKLAWKLKSIAGSNNKTDK
jgi:starvation-inducible DNA-binding protein